MKLFLLGFITAILAYLLYALLRWIAVFMWGDWQTGEIWSTLKVRRKRRKYLESLEKDT